MTALFALDQVSTLLSTPSEALPRQAATGGWLTSGRMSKRVGFLVLHDGSSVAPLQVVVPDALLQEQPALRGLTAGCSVRVRGTLVVSQGAGQRLEMQADVPCRTCEHAWFTWPRWRGFGTCWPRPSTGISPSTASSGWPRPC